MTTNGTRSSKRTQSTTCYQPQAPEPKAVKDHHSIKYTFFCRYFHLTPEQWLVTFYLLMSFYHRLNLLVICLLLTLTPELLSETPTEEPSNLILNGDFSEALLKWNIAPADSKTIFTTGPTEGVKHSNSLKAQIPFVEGMKNYDFSLSQHFWQTLPEGSIFVLKFWARAPKGGLFWARVLSVTSYDLKIGIRGVVKPTPDWKEYRFEGKVGTPDKQIETSAKRVLLSEGDGI